MDFRPEVFVAMSFAPKFKARYSEVIEPAVRSVTIGKTRLEPRRVDLSRSGDSILTEIMDGIAHSQMVIADISTTHRHCGTKTACRNGNVMYEVGLAVACRQPCEVLLIRDDADSLLFDVSTIPVLTLDFRDVGEAQATIAQTVVARLRERKTLWDYRVERALLALSQAELEVLRTWCEFATNQVFGVENAMNFLMLSAIPRLLDKGVLQLAGSFDLGCPAYMWTPLGYAVAQRVKQGLPEYALPKPEDVQDKAAGVEKKPEPASAEHFSPSG